MFYVVASDKYIWFTFQYVYVCFIKISSIICIFFTELFLFSLPEGHVVIDRVYFFTVTVVIIFHF